MSALDRAFIKAYIDAPSRSGAAAPRMAVKPAAEGEPTTMAHAVLSSLGTPGPAARPPEPPSVPLAPRPARATAPLSSFAVAAKPEPPRTVVELDELAWPKACCDMLEQAQRNWEQFADRLADRIAQGQKCVAIASCYAGDGRTTVALATAKQLGARGIRTAVVDTHHDNPNLAQSCRITPQAGWTEVVEDDRSLDEVLIVSTTDNVALLPCRGRGRGDTPPADAVHIAATFETLKDRFDLVVIDTAPLSGPAAVAALGELAGAAGLDAVYMIRDARTGTGAGDEFAATCARLAQVGLEVAGAIHNFVEPAVIQHSRLPFKLPKFAGRLLATRG